MTAKAVTSPLELVRDPVWGGRIRPSARVNRHLALPQQRESARKYFEHAGLAAPNFEFF